MPDLELPVAEVPLGGSDYPFVDPSDDIVPLWRDAYLAYEDRACQLQRPFHVYWLYGFGSIVAPPPPGVPAPTHIFDILIVDDDGVEVFDSTAASSFELADWGADLQIIEWKTATAVARVVRRRTEASNAPVTNFPDNISPDNGELDERIVFKLPPRVNSLTIGLTTVGPDKSPILESGYNVDLTAVTPTLVDGGRFTTELEISAAPGGGIGRFPGCEDPDIVLRRVNGQIADSNGNLLLDTAQDSGEGGSGGGCYHIVVPTVITSEIPREATVVPATLEVRNDCGPCCDCLDYINTYRGIRRTWERLRDLGIQAEDDRDRHSSNIIRWNEQKNCRELNPTRIVTIPFCPCVVGVGCSWCNLGPSCELDVELRITCTWFDRDGQEVTDTDADTVCDTTLLGGTQPYALGGSWPVYRVFLDSVEPQQNANVAFRLEFPGCQSGDAVEILLEVYTGGSFRGGRTLVTPLLTDCAC